MRAHFSRWGTVTDVYFPRHKKTLKRRPFCFVTFACTEVRARGAPQPPQAGRRRAACSAVGFLAGALQGGAAGGAACACSGAAAALGPSAPCLAGVQLTAAAPLRAASQPQAAERALAESPLNICGIPIKNLTMVEDRDAYYRTKHANTRAALLQVGGAGGRCAGRAGAQGPAEGERA